MDITQTNNSKETEAEEQRENLTADEQRRNNYSMASNSDGGVETEAVSSEKAANSEEEEDEEEEEEEEEVEPKLKYQRITNDLTSILRTDYATCLAVHSKFIIVGTHWGSIKVLDHQGNIVNKVFAANSMIVGLNQLSLDDNGEYFASCCEDGKVFIHGLYSADCNHQQSFDRPVKAIAIDPQFYKLGYNRRFVTGHDKLILHERGFLNRLKTTTLHEFDGIIRNIKWCGQFIAWSSDKGVRILDINEHKIITLIKKEDDHAKYRPELYRWNLVWKDNFTLLIGWADIIKICAVKQNFVSQDMARDTPSHYVQIVSAFTTDFYISGLAPFDDDLVVLCTNKETKEKTESRPQLCVIKPQLEDYTCVCTDLLSIRGYEDYSCNLYNLDYLKEENSYFMITPKDVIIARSMDADDHISWLIDHARFEEALIAVTNADAKSLKQHTAVAVGRAYLDHLLNEQQYEKATSLCTKILGSDKSHWEEVVYKFMQINKLKEIASYLPYNDVKLSPTIYEMVLNEFLQSDYKGFYQFIQKWPSDLYEIQTVIVAVKDKIAYDPNSPLLLQSLGTLYTFQKEYDKALSIYLRLGLKDVFNLICEHQLFKTVADQLETLMMLDTNEAVKLCLENIDKLPVDVVVERLSQRRDLQYHYLSQLVAKAPHQAGQYHGLLVLLYAEHQSEKLLSFLKSSNCYPLQDALEICKQYSLIHEQVYLLGRTGNLRQALQLITHSLEDVNAAIDFCVEHDDKELWEDLIEYSLDKPGFIKVLLHNIGTYVDPIVFIKRINNKLEIPDLRQSLVKILQDFNLQISVREGCKKILVSDCFSLQERLHKHQNRGLSVSEDMCCHACQREIIVKDSRQANNVVMFWCKHIFHENCIPGLHMDICPICSSQKKGSAENSLYHFST